MLGGCDGESVQDLGVLLARESRGELGGVFECLGHRCSSAQASYRQHAPYPGYVSTAMSHTACRIRRAPARQTKGPAPVGAGPFRRRVSGVGALACCERDARGGDDAATDEQPGQVHAVVAVVGDEGGLGRAGDEQDVGAVDGVSRSVGADDLGGLVVLLDLDGLGSGRDGVWCRLGLRLRLGRPWLGLRLGGLVLGLVGLREVGLGLGLGDREVLGPLGFSG